MAIISDKQVALISDELASMVVTGLLPGKGSGVHFAGFQGGGATQRTKNPLSKKKTSEMAFWQSIERAVRIKNAIN
jgi:hypothetical protein